MMIPADSDTQHLILLQAGGKALDSMGSESGVLSRAPLTAISKARIYTSLQTTVLARPGIVAAIGPLDRFRIIDYVITTSSPASTFGACSKPVGWVSAAVSESHVAPKGSANPATGPGTETGYNPFPPGTPWNRGNFPGYSCSFGSVTISHSGAAIKGSTFQLLVTSFVYSGGVSNPTILDLFITDVYQPPTGAGGAAMTFPQVIVGTGRMPSPRPGQDIGFIQQVDRYYTSLPTGAPVKFEFKIDGVTWAEKNCLFKGSGWPKAPTLKCQ